MYRSPATMSRWHFVARGVPLRALCVSWLRKTDDITIIAVAIAHLVISGYP